MEYRKFGITDLSVSEVGFGAWAIGGSANVGGVEIGWGPSDDRESEKALLAAFDAGITFFDTADFYGLGHSEELIGRVLGKNQDALIATKVGQSVGKDGTIQIDYSKDYLIQACENSLRRLKRETIDFYQLHVARLAHLEDGACIEAMELLRQQGKIRYWGSSLITFTPDPEAEFLMSAGKGHGFQVAFNLINQLALPIIQEAGMNGYGIIARMPLQFGLLSGKMNSETNFSKDDHRSNRLTPDIIGAVNQVLNQQVMPLTEKYETSLSSLALSFVLSFDKVSTVIPGIRTAEQVKQNTTGLVKLPEEDRQFLQDLYEKKWGPILEMIRARG
ncbi:aldo/keto reductase [Algoriphagus sp. AK58]|uniref:aldo/keto reductase n=1 Tax=Algoriphagus sp. AK58 TaxID=1406877 RepID=UPI00164F822C|nr:aldo/keto reductase [Algoriphagus sp. AK58]MBC6369003.1 aldo/keto reductase [Algoriphagus sp. AK58]